MSFLFQPLHVFVALLIEYVRKHKTWQATTSVYRNIYARLPGVFHGDISLSSGTYDPAG